MPSRFVRLSSALLLLAAATAPAIAQGASKAPAPKAADGWKWLFNGTSMDAWRGFKMTTMPEGWSIVDGTLAKNKPVEDLVSKEQFGNFELEFEWKLGKEGNSGVFYRATEEETKVYWTATEYQLLDDANAPDGRNKLTSAAANYGLYPPTMAMTKPADQWNTSRIVVRGNHAEHWLNGTKVVEYEYWSPDYVAKLKASKFAEHPLYGKATKGVIAIQGDHNGALALRNIRIREISAKEQK